MSVNLNYGKEISHSGATAGYRAWLAYYPKQKTTIIVLSNDASGNVVGAGYEISDLLFGHDEKKVIEQKAINLSEAELKRFTGTYKSIRGYDVFGVEYKDGKIFSNGMELGASHRDTLFLDERKWTLVKSTKMLFLNGADTTSYALVNPPDLNPKSLEAFKGTYFSEEADATYSVDVRTNEVWITVQAFPPFRLTPSFQNGFFTDDYRLFEFKRDKKGKVIGLEVSLSRAERVPFVKKK